jgi:hypothetical protein
MHWLSEHAGTGLKDLPSNTAWLLSRALQPAESAGNAAESAASGTREKARKLKETVVDAAPIGDSVEARLKRARAAAERAEQAEQDALEAAQEAKESAERAERTAAEDRAGLLDLERELDRRVEERVTAARRAADEQVERDRAAVQTEADQELEARRGEVEQEIEGAQRDAESAQERAKTLVEEADQRLGEARRLAAEAAEAARAAAEEAHQQAQRLAADAEQQARAADAQVVAAQRVEGSAKTTAKPPLAKDRPAQGATSASGSEPRSTATPTKAESNSAIERVTR